LKEPPGRRFIMVLAGSHRFINMADPITRPDQLPHLFPVQPVRLAGPVFKTMMTTMLVYI